MKQFVNLVTSTQSDINDVSKFYHGELDKINEKRDQLIKEREDQSGCLKRYISHLKTEFFRELRYELSDNIDLFRAMYIDNTYTLIVQEVECLIEKTDPHVVSVTIKEPVGKIGLRVQLDTRTYTMHLNTLTDESAHSKPKTLAP